MNRERTGKGSGAAAAFALMPLLAVGCGDGTPSSDRVTAGKELYRTTCVVCHGPEAKGTPMRGKDLHGNEFVAGLSDAELVAFLREGRPASHPLNQRGIAMPPRGGNPSLSDDELGLIGDYLRSIQSAR